METNFRPFNWTHKTSIVYKSFPIRSPKALKTFLIFQGIPSLIDFPIPDF